MCCARTHACVRALGEGTHSRVRGGGGGQERGGTRPVEAFSGRGDRLGIVTHTIHAPPTWATRPVNLRMQSPDVNRDERTHVGRRVLCGLRTACRVPSERLDRSGCVIRIGSVGSCLGEHR